MKHEPGNGWQPITPPTRPQATSNSEWMPHTLGGWIAVLVLGALVVGGVMSLAAAF